MSTRRPVRQRPRWRWGVYMGVLTFAAILSGPFGFIFMTVFLAFVETT